MEEVSSESFISNSENSNPKTHSIKFTSPLRKNKIKKAPNLENLEIMKHIVKTVTIKMEVSKKLLSA